MTEAGAQSFYITTAIDYPNGAPHIGHSMEKVAADVMARFHRLLGDDVAFTMGLDENSQHIVTAAKTAGMATGPFTDEMDEVFRASWDALQISRTSWVRTTEPRHFEASQELFRRAVRQHLRRPCAGWCRTRRNILRRRQAGRWPLPEPSVDHAGMVRGELFLRAEPLHRVHARAHRSATRSSSPRRPGRRKSMSLVDAGLPRFFGIAAGPRRVPSHRAYRFPAIRGTCSTSGSIADHLPDRV
ncbi:MAG: class I tRNA ligase family protein [Thermomicrobiales bacterium]